MADKKDVSHDEYSHA